MRHFVDGTKKPLRDVAEWQQEQCEENGQQCHGCPDLILREKKEENRNEQGSTDGSM